MQTYPTKEQCLAVNGGHAWAHYEKAKLLDVEAISNEDACMYCPARRVYRQVQEPKFEWVEE